MLEQHILDDIKLRDVDELEYWLEDEKGSIFGRNEELIAAIRAELKGRS